MNILYLELTPRDLDNPRVAPAHLQEQMMRYQKVIFSKYLVMHGGIYRKSEVVLYYNGNGGDPFPWRITREAFHSPPPTPIEYTAAIQGGGSNLYGLGGSQWPLTIQNGYAYDDHKYASYHPYKFSNDTIYNDYKPTPMELDTMPEFKEIYGQAFIDAALKIDKEKFQKDIEEILKNIKEIK